LDKWTIDLPLQETVEAKAQDLGNPRKGTIVFIDGADEKGTEFASRLLTEAHILVESWKDTKVILTSRPNPVFEKQESIQVPLLSQTEAHSIISRIAEQPISTFRFYSWPDSVREAILRPLYAVLMGGYLREDSGQAPSSTVEMLSSLVRRSLKQVHADHSEAIHLLKRLAKESTNQGGEPVPVTVIAPWGELQSLLDSRLVIERSEAIAFQLSILTEWFAAQGLAEGDPPIDGLVDNSRQLKNWRYPLVIAVATLDQVKISSLLIPLAERRPAFAANVMAKALRREELTEITPPPSALDCGKQIREAMQAWIRGLGPLAQVIAPVDRNVSLLPMGVSVNDTYLTVVWFVEDEKLPDVISLSDQFDLRKLPPFIWMQTTSIGYQSAWAWQWTHRYLVEGLSKSLRKRKLLVDNGSLMREFVWKTAITVTRHGSLNHNPIPLTEIEERLNEVENVDLYDLRFLEREVKRLRQAGNGYLHPPWPGSDRDLQGGGRIWDLYTPNQLLARARRVYEGALRGYQELVEAWFPNMSNDLRTSVLLPAKLIGALVLPQEGERFNSSTISWYLEPLPAGSESVVDIRLREQHIPMRKLLRPLAEQIRAQRPAAAQWIGASLHGRAIELSSERPMTDLAYQWLCEDLKQVSWVDGICS
jgi:hypothetical protein